MRGRRDNYRCLIVLSVGRVRFYDLPQAGWLFVFSRLKVRAVGAQGACFSASKPERMLLQGIRLDEMTYRRRVNRAPELSVKSGGEDIVVSAASRCTPAQSMGNVRAQSWTNTLMQTEVDSHTKARRQVEL